MKTAPQNQTGNTTAPTNAKATPTPRRMRRSRRPIMTQDQPNPVHPANPANPVDPVQNPSSPSSPSSSSSSSSSSVSSVSSVPPVVKLKKERARPFQPLPEFAHLRPDQLDFIHDLFRTRTLEDIKQQLYMDLGASLSIATLHRYRAQLDLADQLQIAENVAENSADTQSPVDHLRDLYAARPTQLDAAGLQIIKQRALELAASPKTSPSLFKDLHRIFTYEDRKQEKQLTLELRHTQRLKLANLREQTRLQIANQREAARQRQLELAGKRYELEVRKQDYRENIDAQNAPQKSNIDEARENAEAFLACGREYLRREREKEAANLAAALIPNPSNPEENCQTIET